MLDAGGQLSKALQDNRRAYLQIAKGEVQCNGVQLSAGDAAKIEAETAIELIAMTEAEVLWFDLP